jgi:hypothetical protein
MGAACARHGMCELTNGMAGERHGNGMGTAWARHAMSESAFSLSVSKFTKLFSFFFVTHLNKPAGSF